MRVLAMIIWIFTNLFCYNYAQINVSDAIVLGGYNVNGAGNDPTMVTATANGLASVLAVRTFVRDSSGRYGRLAVSLTTTGTSGAASYSSSTGVFNVPNYTQYAPTVNSNVARSLNSAFTVSATYQAWVCYSVQISVTLAVSSLTGTVTLQYSTNGGSSYISLPKVAFTPAAAGLGLATSQIVQVNGYVPANALVKITTTTVSGVSYTYSDGQEVY